MADLIDRQKAIRNICNEDCHQPTPCKWKCIAIEELEDLPSVQPRTGKWRYRNGKPATIGMSYSVICSECNLWSEYCTNFCPNCGADMRGEHDG